MHCLRALYPVASNFKVQVRDAYGSGDDARVQVYRHLEVADDCVGELNTNCDKRARGAIQYRQLPLEADAPQLVLR